jgi:hypothetical protein
MVPGNHDRYTLRAHRSRRFERYFGEFSPGMPYPWLRWLDPETAILGLDPTRSAISARGKLPVAQLARASEILKSAGPLRRLLIACHYPVVVPPQFAHEIAGKPLVNRVDVSRWLRTLGPHIYCCGHVHAAWAYHPDGIPNQLCVNPGAPLLRDRFGHRPPGFLEITLEHRTVTVKHHGWTSDGWHVRLLCEAAGFLALGARVES